MTGAGATGVLPLQLGWRLPYEIDGEALRRTEDRSIGQVAALVACLPPALRALRVDPVNGLRAE